MSNNQWIDEEVARLHREINNCEHCKSLREQIMRLLNIRTPDPIVVKREQLLTWLRSGNEQK